ncbi:3-carboxy-cis,cis-muconate cycloisomerase [Tistlia consotensis]|uniref:3-carboxy-cis,cis-muconate cycloisomerase n=1 Tax=Tistlia consotensis USBA 355 TaxID=560819 RepID=A0A1Y6BK62_9PROT|nr:3-carboxy-cis,cis-muconate cycloisomerase [Tistlia consotensis]SMF07901.1 3-carboxy-cis,cis-muconate cycloisomerase [Tistlia consotensis USBA 355]SNR35651.1 3-carboxy-cis,cis-muconate cycloisomerase [Tistlia consotensis]
MPSLVLESKLFGEMFGSAEMRALFSDEAIVQRYLDVEAALARAQSGLGLIPAEAGAAITAAARVEKVDWEPLAKKTRLVGYPIKPLVDQLSTWAEDGLGRYAHWGATTQDIMDTADVLQLRDALALVEADLEAIAASLATLAEMHAETPMAGRTHLQHALPITFGYKAATWLSGIDRHRERLRELKPRLLVGQFAGAAGTLASLGDRGLEVQDALMAELGLGRPAMTWHTIRDAFAETSGFLALVAASLGKIGYDIMLLMQTEVGEVFEPFIPGRGSSSTMPQKRNPIASELMLAAAKLAREQHAAMLDALVQDHERATGQWQVEWQALPTAFLAASAGLKAARETLAGLEVHPEAMRRTLESSGGLIVAEAVMMGLASKLGRGVAHDLVYDCCRRALDEGIAFLDALAAEPRIAAAASRAELAALVEPANYLGVAPQMVRRLLAGRR